MELTLFEHQFKRGGVKQKIRDDLLVSLKKVDFEFQLNSAKEIRTKITEVLLSLGWSDKIKIDPSSGISITALNSEVGLCLQVGNMARFYADLLKLQTLFINNKIKSAIYILPTKETSAKMGQNIANFDRMTDELKIFEQTITLPILVIGIK